MPCCYNTTRALVLFFLTVGLVGIVLAGVIDFWWKIDIPLINSLGVSIDPIEQGKEIDTKKKIFS